MSSPSMHVLQTPTDFSTLTKVPELQLVNHTQDRPCTISRVDAFGHLASTLASRQASRHVPLPVQTLTGTAIPLSLPKLLKLVPLCYSSCWMNKLISWRNPQESLSTLQSLLFAGKVFATELALPVLAVSAAVETVAYACLFSVSSLCQLARPNSERVRDYTCYSKDLLKSSSTTIYWGIKNFTYSNLFKRHVEENEFPIRKELEGYSARVFSAA